VIVSGPRVGPAGERGHRRSLLHPRCRGSGHPNERSRAPAARDPRALGRPLVHMPRNIYCNSATTRPRPAAMRRPRPRTRLHRADRGARRVPDLYYSHNLHFLSDAYAWREGSPTPAEQRAPVTNVQPRSGTCRWGEFLMGAPMLGRPALRPLGRSARRTEQRLDLPITRALWRFAAMTRPGTCTHR